MVIKLLILICEKKNSFVLCDIMKRTKLVQYSCFCFFFCWGLRIICNLQWNHNVCGILILHRWILYFFSFEWFLPISWNYSMLMKWIFSRKISLKCNFKKALLINKSILIKYYWSKLINLTIVLFFFSYLLEDQSV